MASSSTTAIIDDEDGMIDFFLPLPPPLALISMEIWLPLPPLALNTQGNMPLARLPSLDLFEFDAEWEQGLISPSCNKTLDVHTWGTSTI